METSQGFEDFLYEMGINWFQRKLACTSYPTLRISESPDGEVTTTTSSTLRNNILTFSN